MIFSYIDWCIGNVLVFAQLSSKQSYFVVSSYYPFHLVEGVGSIPSLDPNILCIFLAYLYCKYEQ